MMKSAKTKKYYLEKQITPTKIAYQGEYAI